MPDSVTIGSLDNQVAILDRNGNAVSSVQIVSLKPKDSTRDYDFHNLPKYDRSGQVVHYTAVEVWVDGSGRELSRTELAQKFPDAYALIRSYSTGYSDEKYLVGKHRANDQQTMTVSNRLTGTKTVLWHKQWKDTYNYENGLRPDIYPVSYTHLDVYKRQEGNCHNYHTEGRAQYRNRTHLEQMAHFFLGEVVMLLVVPQRQAQEPARLEHHNGDEQERKNPHLTIEIFYRFHSQTPPLIRFFPGKWKSCYLYDTGSCSFTQAKLHFSPLKTGFRRIFSGSAGPLLQKRQKKPPAGLLFRGKPAGGSLHDTGLPGRGRLTLSPAPPDAAAPPGPGCSSVRAPG